MKNKNPRITPGVQLRITHHSLLLLWLPHRYILLVRKHCSVFVVHAQLHGIVARRIIDMLHLDAGITGAIAEIPTIAYNLAHGLGSVEIHRQRRCTGFLVMP